MHVEQHKNSYFWFLSKEYTEDSFSLSRKKNRRLNVTNVQLSNFKAIELLLTMRKHCTWRKSGKKLWSLYPGVSLGAFNFKSSQRLLLYHNHTVPNSYWLNNLLILIELMRQSRFENQGANAYFLIFLYIFFLLFFPPQIIISEASVWNLFSRRSIELLYNEWEKVVNKQLMLHIP